MFKFNEKYSDLEQVRPYFEDFLKVKESIDGFAYNSLFKNKIPALIGEDEDTAIYLLQQLKTETNKQAIINEAIKNGYQFASSDQRIVKYKKVLMVGTNYSKDDTKEFENASVLYDKGYVEAIMPARHTRTGYRPSGKVLVLA